MIKDLVEIFQKYLKDPSEYSQILPSWHNGIRYDSDDDGFYFILGNEKYRCLNEEIKNIIRLPSKNTFDPRKNILICQDTFLESNNDPMEKYVLVQITDNDLLLSHSIPKMNRIPISSKNDNEIYVIGLEIECLRDTHKFVSIINNILEFLTEPLNLEYIDKNKTSSRDLILNCFKHFADDYNLQAKPIENGFRFTLKGMKYTCATETEYFKIGDDCPFNSETDILVSGERFARDDGRRSDRFAVIQVRNEYQNPHNRVITCEPGFMLDNYGKDVGGLFRITLFLKNNRYHKSDFEYCFKSILQSLLSPSLKHRSEDQY